MASFVVDGLVVPISVTTHPALNLCNTRAGWAEPRPKEYLASHSHLSVWARENAVVSAAEASELRQLGAADPASAAEVIDRAIAFRSALYAVLVGDRGRDDQAAVNAEVHRAVSAAILRWPDPASAPAQAVWAIARECPLDLPLLRVAWSAATLLTSPAASQVAACPGRGCGWLFADARGRRRWCSMAWCGNRAKVRRYAQRQRET